VAFFECEPELLPRFCLLVSEHEDAAFKVSELNAPTHGEEVLAKVRIVAIELHVYPLHQVLTVLNVV
jgi:hypothetical protein